MNQSARMSPPVVRTRSAGRVSETLETFARIYREANADMDCRYVYDPQHKPELSNKMSRLAMGYKPIFFKDLGDEEKLKSMGLTNSLEDEVRVADTILMGIPADLKRGYEQENAERAAEQARSVDRAFHQAFDEANAGLAQHHRARPIGRSVIEEREFEFDYQQREGGE